MRVIAQNQVSYRVIRFGPGDEASLLERAREVVPPSQMRPRGRSHERWLSYLAGRAALSDLLRPLNLGARVEANPEFGYLTVRSDKGVPLPFVNISHTASVAVGAMAPSPIGIDIESVHRSADKVLARITTADERDELPHKIRIAGEREIVSSIALWSAKEAVSKATGLGIKFGLQRFRVRVSSTENGASVETDLRGPLAIKDPAIWWGLSGEDLISICTESPLLNKVVELC